MTLGDCELILAIAVVALYFSGLIDQMATKHNPPTTIKLNDDY